MPSTFHRIHSPSWCCATSILPGSLRRLQKALPKFGKLFGWSGIGLGALLLALNMRTFPIAPAEAGSIDLGPLVALWFLAVFIRMLTLRDWMRER